MQKTSTFAIRTSRPANQKLQKSLFSPRKKLANASQKLNLATAQPDRKTILHRGQFRGQTLCNFTVDSISGDRTTGYNSGLAEMAGSVRKETFVHLINFVPGDSEVLRTPPLRKPANR